MISLEILACDTIDRSRLNANIIGVTQLGKQVILIDGELLLKFATNIISILLIRSSNHVIWIHFPNKPR